MLATRVTTCACLPNKSGSSKKEISKKHMTKPIRNEFVTYFDVKHLNNDTAMNDVPDDAPIVNWEKSDLEDFDSMFESDSKR